MEKNKNNTGFAVVVILLVSAVILLTGYIVYDKVLSSKSDDNGTNEIKKEDNKDENKIDVNKLGRELFEKYGDYVYSSENLNYDNLDNEIKLEMALLKSDNIIYNESFKNEFENMDWNNVQVDEEGMAIYPYYFKLDIKNFENSYKNLFGQDKNINYEKFSTMAFTSEELTLPLNCKKEDAYLVCYPFDGGGDFVLIDAFEYNYAKIVDTKLNIYVNYLSLNELGQLCSDFERQNVIDDIIYQNKDLNSSNKSKLFEKYKGKTGVYRLVFNKDSNNNWYWEETQIIKR